MGKFTAAPVQTSRWETFRRIGLIFLLFLDQRVLINFVFKPLVTTKDAIISPPFGSLGSTDRSIIIVIV